MPVLSANSAGDAAASCRAIENLIAACAELVDDGDFAAVGELLAHASFTGAAGTVRGREEMEEMLVDRLIIYEDGTPRTKHLITNVAIEVDEAAGTAVARSYFTILQALPGEQPRVIVSGRYSDRFERQHESWRFVERRVRSDLLGDTSGHIRSSGR
jgi:3-phenylpropionate/cinnamic acid dioxygenase small subunit